MNRQIACLPVVLCIIAGIPAYCQGELKKVSKADAMSAVTAKTPPQYPPVAKQMKVEGVVELQATISEAGKVEKVDILSGNPMLTRPAADALRSWKFKPFEEDGKPVKVLAPVSFSFKVEN
jgi:protein TonB